MLGLVLGAGKSARSTVLVEGALPRWNVLVAPTLGVLAVGRGEQPDEQAGRGLRDGVVSDRRSSSTGESCRIK